MSTEGAAPANGQIQDLRETLVARPASALGKVGVGTAAVGGLLSLAALLSPSGRVHFGYGYLWGFTLVWTIVIGNLFFVALQHLTGARWSIVVRRVSEMFVSPVWLLAPLSLPLIAFVAWPETFHVFPWADSTKVAADQHLAAKTPYLNLGFFAVRVAAFFALWVGFGLYFVRTSLMQDSGAATAKASQTMKNLSAPFMLLFAVTVTFAGIDWLMSLAPKWFSTMFGVYVFAGMVVASLAALTLALVRMVDTGRLGTGLIRPDHLYSLGTLMFAFVCFWAYIAFSQYMLIWYGNMPEETFYLVDRTRGGWLAVSVALAVVRFVIPFLVLLPRGAKTNHKTLTWVSVLLLIGQALDLYWVIMPQIAKNAPAELTGAAVGTPAVSWAQFGPIVLMVGGLLVYVSYFLARWRPVAVGDPLFTASKDFHL